MTKPNAWPQEWLDLLGELAAEGHSAEVIAATINRRFKTDKTRNAIIGKLKRQGLQLKGKSGRAATVKLPAAPKAPKTLKASQVKPKPRPLRFIVHRPVPASPVTGEPHTVPVPLMLRKHHQCGWPVNDGNPFLFCAQPKRAGDPDYCEYHRLLSLPAPRLPAPRLPAPRRAAYLREACP